MTPPQARGRWSSSFLGRVLAAWRTSTLLRPHLISILHLLSGSLGNMLLTMASLAIVTRTLSPHEFGIMVVVLSIGRVCERLIRFESWQPLVRFVAAEEMGGDTGRVASLYAYGLMLDLSAAFVAALLSIAVAVVAGSAVGLDPADVGLVVIYAGAIACNARGMASAALRMNGKFRILAYAQLASCLVRLALAVALLASGGGLVAFVIVWTFSQVLDALLLNVLALGALRHSGVPSPLKADRRSLHRRFPGFIRFALSTNLSSMMRAVTHEMDTLLVSMFAGAGAAGLYYLSRRIAKVAQTAGDMIQTVVYPDLARLWSRHDGGEFKRVVAMLQLGLAGMAGAALGACWIIGRPALEFAFGDTFGDSYPMLLVQLFAVLLTLHSAPARSALLAMNRPGYVLGASIVSTCLFAVTAVACIPANGGVGANVAHVVAAFATAALMDFAFWRVRRRARMPIVPALQSDR
jgi:O-antigen/teichoic acid export membrane protein